MLAWDFGSWEQNMSDVSVHAKSPYHWIRSRHIWHMHKTRWHFTTPSIARRWLWRKCFSFSARMVKAVQELINQKCLCQQQEGKSPERKHELFHLSPIQIATEQNMLIQKPGHGDVLTTHQRCQISNFFQIRSSRERTIYCLFMPGWYKPHVVLSSRTWTTGEEIFQIFHVQLTQAHLSNDVQVDILENALL